MVSKAFIAKQGKCCSIVLLVAGSALLISAIITGTMILHTLKVKLTEVSNTANKYEVDPNYADPNYDKCTNDTNVYYFFNLTNFEAAKGGAPMMWEEVGPYQFNRSTCKFSANISNGYETAHVYKPPADFMPEKSGAGLSENDVIYGFNFPYAGMLKAFEKFNPMNPEAELPKVLAPGFVAQYVSQINLSIQGGTAAGYLNQFRGTFLWNVFNSMQANKTAFFNELNYPNGFANFINSSQALTPESINIILNGYNSTVRGLNSLIYSFAALPASDNTKYGVTPAEFADLKLWTTHIVNAVIPAWEMVAVAPPNVVFLTQWANASTAVTWPAGMMPLGLTPAQANALWNATDPLSFANSAGTTAWMSSARATQLTAHFGITADQTTAIMNWFMYNLNNVTNPMLLARLGPAGITSVSQLGIFQWATGAVLPASIFYLANNPALVPAIPEIALVANASGRHVFPLAKALQIFGFMQTPYFANTLTGLYATGQTAALSAVYNLTMEEAGSLSSYFNYFGVNFVDPAIRGIFATGKAGPLVGRTVKEWLYTGVDPLFSFMNIPSGVGYLAKKPLTREAAKLKTYSEKIWEGGSKEALGEYFEVRDYMGNHTVTAYQNGMPFNVSGHDKVFWIVGTFPKGSTIYLWSEELVRALAFEDSGTTKDVYGLKCQIFTASKSVYGSQTDFPDNAKYNQRLEGVMNMSAVGNIRVYITRPHMQDVAPEMASKVMGMKPGKEAYGMLELGIEPRTGILMRAVIPIQINWGVKYVNRYHNLTTGSDETYAPFFWEDTNKGISEHEAKDFRSIVNTVTGVAIGAYVGMGAGGIIQIVQGIVIYRKWKKLNGHKTTHVEEMDDRL